MHSPMILKQGIARRNCKYLINTSCYNCKYIRTDNCPIYLIYNEEKNYKGEYHGKGKVNRSTSYYSWRP